MEVTLASTHRVAEGVLSKLSRTCGTVSGLELELRESFITIAIVVITVGFLTLKVNLWFYSWEELYQKDAK